MAKLQSDNLTLEIKFSRFENDWIAYEISFLWKDKTIINDEILKKGIRRKYGTFLSNDFEKDYLIETIRRVLDTNKPEYWEPVEPDAIIAIYPEIIFPFLNHWIPVDEKEHKEQDVLELSEDEKQYITNEVFTVIAFIDRYEFEDCKSYSSEGIALHLIVTREDLEKFVSDLKKEYDSL